MGLLSSKGPSRKTMSPDHAHRYDDEPTCLHAGVSSADRQGEQEGELSRPVVLVGKAANQGGREGTATCFQRRPCSSSETSTRNPRGPAAAKLGGAVTQNPFIATASP